MRLQAALFFNSYNFLEVGGDGSPPQESGATFFKNVNFLEVDRDGSPPREGGATLFFKNEVGHQKMSIRLVLSNN